MTETGKELDKHFVESALEKVLVGKGALKPADNIYLIEDADSHGRPIYRMLFSSGNKDEQIDLANAKQVLEGTGLLALTDEVPSKFQTTIDVNKQEMQGWFHTKFPDHEKEYKAALTSIRQDIREVGELTKLDGETLIELLTKTSVTVLAEERFEKALGTNKGGGLNEALRGDTKELLEQLEKNGVSMQPIRDRLAQEEMAELGVLPGQSGPVESVESGEAVRPTR